MQESFSWKSWKDILLWVGIKVDLDNLRKRKTRELLPTGGKKHPTAGPNISKALTGRKRSPEQRVNMGKGMLGKPSPTRRAVYCEELDRTFDCIAHAAQYIGGRSPRISQCINGQCPTAYGYHWKAVEK